MRDVSEGFLLKYQLPMKADAGHELADVLGLHYGFNPASQMISLIVDDEQLQALFAVAVVLEGGS